MCRVLALRHPFIKILKASYSAYPHVAPLSYICHWADMVTCAKNMQGVMTRVLSVVPLLAWLVVGDSELQGKSPAYMRSWVGKMRCSFAVAAWWASAVVASTSAVAGAVAGAVERAVEVDSFAVVGAKLGGFVLETVPRRNCCVCFAVVGTIEEGRSAACFDCNMLRLDLLRQVSEGAVPWVTVGIADGFEVDWEGSRMALASDSASAGSFGCWTLVEVLGCCAAGADRN